MLRSSKHRVAYAKGDPWHVVRLAASIGNDSDSIGAMAGAMAGALTGTAGVPPAIISDFVAANPDFDLASLAQQIEMVGDAPKG